MDPVIVKQNEAREFMEGPEICREYIKNEQITFGTSTLLPGETGEIDEGHSHSKEVFFCCQGTVEIFVKETNRKFVINAGDAILIPEGVSHTLKNVGNELAVASWSMAPSE